MTVVYTLENVVKERLIDGSGFRLVVPRIQIRAEENIALIGHSGCGKSTLLDLLALILRPDQSKDMSLHPVQGDNHDLAKLWYRDKHSQLAQIRKRHIEGVFSELGEMSRTEFVRRLLKSKPNDLLERLSATLDTDLQVFGADAQAIPSEQ